MKVQKIMRTVSIFAVSIALNIHAVALLQLKNKTLQPIDVAVMLGELIYAQTRVDALSSATVKVPGVPGKFDVQFTREGLMGNSIEVPVVVGTQLVFDDGTFVIVQPVEK